MMKTYSELIKLTTFDERYKYLKFSGIVGDETFGFDRYLNQRFYKLREWQAVRDYVITRDNGCDLGIPGREIYGPLIVHHMNPISVRDILERKEVVLNPEFLITTIHSTHNAIHYGNNQSITQVFIERLPNDTCPWRKV